MHESSLPLAPAGFLRPLPEVGCRIHFWWLSLPLGACISPQPPLPGTSLLCCGQELATVNTCWKGVDEAESGQAVIFLLLLWKFFFACKRFLTDEEIWVFCFVLPSSLPRHLHQDTRVISSERCAAISGQMEGYIRTSLGWS